MSRPLRALLLAAGLGTRLRPLTKHTPKCLMEIGGEPLLGHWLRKLEAAGCEAVLVNTHHLAEQVVAFLQGWQGRWMAVQSVHEPVLLGTAGTLLTNQAFFTGATGLLIHADNAMAEPLGNLLARHRKRPSHCLLTMLTFATASPSSCGIVELDDQGVVIGFHEKVADPPGNLANAALYVFDGKFLEHLNSFGRGCSDISTEVLPTLIGQMYTCHTSDRYLDIGTPSALKEAQQLWRADR